MKTKRGHWSMNRMASLASSRRGITLSRSRPPKLYRPWCWECRCAQAVGTDTGVRAEAAVFVCTKREFRKDVMQVVLGEGAVGAALIDAPIDKIIFTGSVATGRRVGVGSRAEIFAVRAGARR